METTQFACFGVNEDNKSVQAYGRLGPFDGLGACTQVAAQLFTNGAVTVFTTEWTRFLEENPQYK